MESTRHCNACCGELPIESFRRYRRGQPQRRSECNDCRNRALKVKRANRCRRAISKGLTKILSVRDRNPERELNQVAKLVAAMTKFYGGFDQLVMKWKQSIDEAPPNSMFALRSLNTIVHMIRLTSQEMERKEAKWLRTASNQEVEQRFELEVLRQYERIKAKYGGNVSA